MQLACMSREPDHVPAAPIAITLFGNGLLAHASSRSLQTVVAGVALTLR